jgi:hypothetical protein
MNNLKAIKVSKNTHRLLSETSEITGLSINKILSVILEKKNASDLIKNILKGDK